jgi:hypothetical protein
VAEHQGEEWAEDLHMVGTLDVDVFTVCIARGGLRGAFGLLVVEVGDLRPSALLGLSLALVLAQMRNLTGGRTYRVNR